MPKKVRRGGAGKGAGRSEEERLLFLQQRAQAEEEMARKKEEILTLFLKDKLQKEERNTAVNLLKLNEGWRAILRQTRSTELREDIVILRQTFERQLDGLDSIIQSLGKDLQEAELQSARVQRLHLQHVERLRVLQLKRLAVLQQRWEGGIRQISSRFLVEREQVVTRSTQQRSGLDDALFTLERQHDSVASEIHRAYGDSVAAYQSAHQDRAAALLRGNQDELSQRMRENQEALQRFGGESKEAELLAARNQQLIQMTNADLKRVQRLQTAVIDLRAKLTSLEADNALAADDLTAARAQVSRKTGQLREQLRGARAAARKQLADLSVQSDAAAKKLRAAIAKGERVLRVAMLCRRLESEHGVVLSITSSAEDGELMSDFPELRRLMCRHSDTMLQREAARRQREHLRQENQQLRLLLRQQLDAMTISEDALHGGHNLLTVTRAPTTAGAGGGGGAHTARHTIIEAVHVVKHSL